MSLTVNDPTWSPDLTLACERLAERLHATGVTHPVAAAVALTARGHLGLGQAAFAERIGLDTERVAELEAGRVPFGDLPDDVSAPLGPGLLSLAALSAELDPPLATQQHSTGQRLCSEMIDQSHPQLSRPPDEASDLRRGR